MLKIDANRCAILKVENFRKLVNAEYSELKSKKDIDLLIGISRDRFLNLFYSKKEYENIKLWTALHICNYFDVPPSELLVTDGTIEHKKRNTYEDVILRENIFSNGEGETIEETESLVCEEDLCFLDYMGDSLKKNCLGLLITTGEKGRVSFAIVSIVTYLCMIVNSIPELKENTFSLVKAIAGALHRAVLDSNEQAINDLWPGLKNNIADLKELVGLTDEAKIEANMVIDKLLQSRLDGDDAQKLQAVQAALYWLEDYWPYICYEPAAYGALRNISCVLSEAPTDYKMRKNIVVFINSFIHQVSLYDKSGVYKL